MPTGSPQNTRQRHATQAAHRRVSRAMPHLLERVLQDTQPEDLSPVEIVARDWRLRAIEDLGGPEALTAAREALLNAATGSVILLASLDAYLFALAARDGLANRRSRRAFAIVADRMRVADSLTRQLQALGLERHAKPMPSLNEYLARRYAPEAAMEIAKDNATQEDMAISSERSEKTEETPSTSTETATSPSVATSRGNLPATPNPKEDLTDDEDSRYH